MVGVASSRDYELLLKLLLSSWLPAHGGRVYRTLSGPIAITYKGKCLGAWWFEDGCYHFGLIAFRSADYSARSAEEAVGITLAMVTRIAMGTHAAAQRGMR